MDDLSFLQYSPTTLAFLATLFTWGLTALGASLVFLVPSNLSYSKQRLILDASLGFAGGVMIAASYWSLLAPAIQAAEESGLYGNDGEWAFIPVSSGFLLGAIFVMMADIWIPEDSQDSVQVLTKEKNLLLNKNNCNHEVYEINSQNDNHPMKRRKKLSPKSELETISTRTTRSNSNKSNSRKKNKNGLESNHHENASNDSINNNYNDKNSLQTALEKSQSWHRILLLVVAITIHNFPEGLAVGVGFGALHNKTNNLKTESQLLSLYQSAKSLAIGIGLQNFPEGLAVSLPLMRVGYSRTTAFFYGQASGMVEPIAGLLGCYGISIMAPLLPYALAFAAGAMIFVVVDDLIPETRTPNGYPTLASFFVIIGFIVMMSMDVAL